MNFQYGSDCNYYSEYGLYSNLVITIWKAENNNVVIIEYSSRVFERDI